MEIIIQCSSIERQHSAHAPSGLSVQRLTFNSQRPMSNNRSFLRMLIRYITVQENLSSVATCSGRKLRGLARKLRRACSRLLRIKAVLCIRDGPVERRSR